MATDTRVSPGDRHLHRDLTNGLADIPQDVVASVATEARANGLRPHLTRLTRLTVRFGEPGELQDILSRHNDLVRRYDLLALEPTSERAFVSACNNKRADIITLPLGIRLPFRLRAPAVRAAAANGVALEVSYNPALMDTAARRNFFANATAVVRAAGSGAGGGVGGSFANAFAGAGIGGGGGPAKKRPPPPGVILSGGSRQAMEIRQGHPSIPSRVISPARHGSNEAYASASASTSASASASSFNEPITFNSPTPHPNRSSQRKHLITQASPATASILSFERRRLRLTQRGRVNSRKTKKWTSLSYGVHTTSRTWRRCSG